MVFGASFQPGIDMKVTETTTSTVLGTIIDTAYYYQHKTSVLMPMQLNVGASLVSGDQWMLGAELNYQDFTKTKIMGLQNLGSSYGVKLGGYYIPNMYDVRYFYKRFTYRGGIRYSRTPYMFQEYAVNDFAVTAGVSMPMRGAGYLNISTEVGRRGNTLNGMVQETYVNFAFSITLFEVWFRKYEYE
jgi:hypothetical protein